MNSTRTVPVSLELIKEALEYYWRSSALINDSEKVTLAKYDIPQFGGVYFEAKITTKEVVDTFRL